MSIRNMHIEAYCRADDAESVKVSIRVRTDDDKLFTIQRILPVSYFESRFDVVWRILGEMLHAATLKGGEKENEPQDEHPEWNTHIRLQANALGQ